MRNRVLKKIADNFINDKELYLMLGDLGVFQSRDAIKIDNYRCFNYGIMEQSMVGFASGISMANAYPIIYSITPFIIERCYEQLKLDFGYNKSKGLIISAGGSFDYNKLGPTHYCPNDISLMIKAKCTDIYLPWNELKAEEFVGKIFEKKFFSYLRLSSEEIDGEIMPKDISSFNFKNQDNNLVLGLGPDSYLLAKHLNYQINFSISKIDAKLIDMILNMIQKGINLTIIAGFNLDFILNLIQNTKQKQNSKLLKNGSLSLIYSMDTKYDSAEKKITHLTSNLFFNEFIIK